MNIAVSALLSRPAGSFGVEREHADPLARGDVELGARDLERRLERSCTRTATDSAAIVRRRSRLDRRGEVEVAQQQQELVAPGPGHQVGVARRFAEAVGQEHDQLVADVVAKRVVHQLEVVEVDGDHGDTELVRRARAIVSSSSSSNITRFDRPVSLSWYAR